MGYRNYRTHPCGSVKRPRQSFTRLKYTTIGKDFKGNLRQGLALAVQEFLVPGHLDGFKLRFIGGRGVAGKTGEFGDPLVHVGEADGQRIGVREFVGEADSDVFDIFPTKCWRHFHSKKKLNTEATEKRWRDKPAATAELVIELGVGGLVAGLQAFAHDDVARGAGANAAAGVVEAGFESLGDVQDAAGQTVVAVGNFLRIDLDGLAAGKKRHFIFLRGGLVFDFFDVRIASAHGLSPKRWRHKAAATIRDAQSAYDGSRRGL